MGSTAGEERGTGARHRLLAALKRGHVRAHAHPVSSVVTKAVVTLVGLAFLAGGLIMMVTPGPGIVGIILGLAILATEWPWAEKWVHKAREKAHEAAEKARAMDPAVRRRRLFVTGLAAGAVIGLIALYLAMYDWPGWAIDSWNWVQSLSGAVPELPGM